MFPLDRLFPVRYNYEYISQGRILRSYRFREACEKAGLSAADVSRRIGISQNWKPVPRFLPWRCSASWLIYTAFPLTIFWAESSMSRIRMGPGSCLISAAPNGLPLKWNSESMHRCVKNTSVHFSKWRGIFWIPAYR